MSILVRKMSLNLLLNTTIATSLKMAPTIDVAIERSKVHSILCKQSANQVDLWLQYAQDVSPTVRKISIQLLSELYAFNENQTSRVRILNAIIMATVDVVQTVSNAAVKEARILLFEDKFCERGDIEREELLLLTTKSLYDDGYVEIMKQLFVQVV